jgi:hypothetical protein
MRLVAHCDLILGVMLGALSPISVSVSHKQIDDIKLILHQHNMYVI